MMLLPQSLEMGGFSLTLRDVTATDMQAVLDLHRTVFGPEVDAQWFTWKYGLAAGAGEAVGVWHGDALIAFCGGLPRTLWCAGKPLNGLQIGDVMVHPQWRGLMTRKGVFFHVSKSFYDSRLGELPQPFSWGYGFPSQRHLRLAVVHGLLHDAGAIEALHWSVDNTAALPWHWRWQPLDPQNSAFDPQVDAAWKGMQARAGHLTLGQHDAAYVRWRYVDRPLPSGSTDAAPRYRFFGLRRLWSRQCTGIVVMDLRQADGAAAHCLDWIGPTDFLPLALQACRLEAARHRASHVMAWASPAVAQILTETGIVERTVCAGFGAPTASSASADTIRSASWWMMGGDTDFL